MSNKPKTKNDLAWEKLFDKYNIVEEVNKEGFFTISSAQINEFREARLMTKFDHKNSLPQLFEKESLAILPISRGDYIIGRFEAYHTLEKSNVEIARFSFPEYIKSIDYENITSEANAINTAYITGILSDFIGDDNLLPTVNGRMSSEIFDFLIQGTVTSTLMPISVTNSQVEIDGGYEGYQSLAIIEAKNSISDDFLIRQLYYPYRLWEQKLIKPIRPIFFTYSNGIYRLYEYCFEEPREYNSLVLRKQKNYAIEPKNITFDEVFTVFKGLDIIHEPRDIPFPQADSFDRVINLCELLYENNTLSRDEITYRYDFDSRQTDYYANAGRYLGLIHKMIDEGTVQYCLTDKGSNLFQHSIKTRELRLIKSILEHKPFYHTYELFLQRSKMPSTEEIVDIMKKSDLCNIKSDSTFHRRSSTIASWINWIIELTNQT